MSKKETILYKAVMDYRRSKGLPEIPASHTLTRVAQAHTKDLFEMRPSASSSCNMHSWSHSEQWTDCCYTSDHSKSKCMWDKPREFTKGKFSGNGFEISYGSPSMEEIANPVDALSSWKTSSGHNTVIVNEGIWERYNWKSIGVGIYKGFVCVWFSDTEDPFGSITACD